jgi:type II secretory pathway pseudopilin PulG
MKHRSHIRRRRGFFMIDTIVGFMVIGMVALLLVVAVTDSGKAQRRIEDSGTALRAAERAMTALQEGRAAPKTVGEAQIVVGPAKGGAAVDGRQWVEVTATYNGRKAGLVGLVPQGGAK